MKWYSVKKYKPPRNSNLFILTDCGYIWTAQHSENHQEKDMVLAFVEDVDYTVIKNVTHFCIPEPVEIEE